MHLLHQQADARSLAALRIFVFGLWFVKILCDPFPDLADYPADLFRPPGVLKLLPDAAWGLLFTSTGLWTVKFVLLATLLAAAAGRRFRPSAAIATLLLVLQQGLVRGFTYIYHEELSLLYAAALLALFPCDDALRPGESALAPPADRRVYAAGMLSVAAMLCLCFCFTGVLRCVAGGLELFSSDSLRVWIFRNAFASPFPWAGLGPAAVNHPNIYALLTIGLGVTTLFEICAPFALVSRPFRRLFVPVMLLFLILNMLLMNLIFWESALLLVVLADWPEPAGRSVALQGRMGLTRNSLTIA